MTLSALTTDYRLSTPNHWSDNPHVADIVDDYEKMQERLRELEEENAWLRYSLDKYGLLDTAEALIPESHFTESTSVAA